MNSEPREELLASIICTTLMRVGIRMATLFDQSLSSYGITQAQFRVLMGVKELGNEAGVAPSVLADHLLIERGTVTVLTSRMVELGWLSRAPGENRRTFRLCMTKLGGAKFQEVVPAAIALADQTLEGASLEELKQVLDRLAKLEDHLRAAPDSS